MFSMASWQPCSQAPKLPAGDSTPGSFSIGACQHETATDEVDRCFRRSNFIGLRQFRIDLHQAASDAGLLDLHQPL